MTVEATKLTGDLAQVSVGLTGAQTQVIGLMEWSIDWKLKMVNSNTTDDQGHDSNLPSNDSWTATAKFAYIDGDTSQLANILAAIQTRQGAQTFNFFPTVEASRASWQGKAYISSIKISGGVGKIFGTDITLTGTGVLAQPVQLAPTAGVAEN